MPVLRVREPFACEVDGHPAVFRAGDLLHSSNPVVKGREQHFETAEEFVDRSTPLVEAATAAPGEKRTRTRIKRSEGPVVGPDAA